MILALMLAAALAPAETSTTQCDQLKSLSLTNTTITTTEIVAAGSPTNGTGGAQRVPERGQPAAALPAYCRVVAVLKPSSDSNINVEVWLPLQENWNGKFQAVGNGGWAGSIQGFASMQSALRNGYAAAGTDTGHTGEGLSGEFALGHPEKVVDFAYRAIHEMTVQSKALIKAFYGKSQRLSYFNGCSTGGRQALMEAQRYPEDFDAILAGAPANKHIHLHAADLARISDIFKDPAGFIPQSKQNVLAQAVLNACDNLDGIKDSLVSNPVVCKFDPAVLLCKNGDSPDCLTAPQVQTAKRIYADARTSNGELVFPGFSFGGENILNVMRGGTEPRSLPLDTFRYLAHQDRNWDWRTFNLDRDLALAMKNAGFINATNPDLSKFKKRGGKLLLYHGWADPAIGAGNTVDYYKSVLAKMGQKQDEWLLLFMVPGMGHCGGGSGPNRVEWMAELERWKENKTGPAHIIGRGAQGMTRPICPFPQVAEYKGSGDPNDAANFVCKAP
jgi:feruloyl esterase